MDLASKRVAKIISPLIKKRKGENYYFVQEKSTVLFVQNMAKSPAMDIVPAPMFVKEKKKAARFNAHGFYLIKK